MIERLPIDLIVEIGILTGPDEYEQIAQTSMRNAIILQKPYIVRATNAFIVNESWIQFGSTIVNEYRYLGRLHSFNNQPAIIYKQIYNDQPACATQLWYKHGKLHRDNGLPAVIRADGVQNWFQHGKLINVK
jgi:hypothetical protein